MAFVVKKSYRIRILFMKGIFIQDSASKEWSRNANANIKLALFRLRQGVLIYYQNAL
jgi:hypothetical protein